MASALSEADGIDYTDPEEVSFPIKFDSFMIDICSHYLSIDIEYSFLLGAAWVVDHNSYRPWCNGW